jgi:hypothetical protein
VEAQRIAFAPITQACRVLRDSGILELVRATAARAT